jgi:protein SCO1
MLAERDAIATALLAKYKNIVMPNLRLARDEVEAVLQYMEAETAARQGQVATQPVAVSATERAPAHDHHHHHHGTGTME